MVSANLHILIEYWWGVNESCGHVGENVNGVTDSGRVLFTVCKECALRQKKEQLMRFFDGHRN